MGYRRYMAPLAAGAVAALALFWLSRYGHRGAPDGVMPAEASRSPRTGAPPAPPGPRVTVTDSNAWPGTLAYGFEGGNPKTRTATIVLQSPGGAPQLVPLRPEFTGCVPFDPVISPDGRRIAFTDGLVVDANPARISIWDRNTRTPAHTDVIMLDTRFLWSPDSLHIAYVYGGNGIREEPMRLGIYDVRGNKTRWIARNSGVHFMSWTSRNTLLYATEPGDDVSTPGEPSSPPARRARIYEIGADGGIPRLVIPDVGTGVDAPGSGYGPLPVPSPDGCWIAIRDCPPGFDRREWVAWSQRDNHLPPAATGGGTGDDVSKWGDGIYLFDRESGKKRLLIPLSFQEAPLLFWTPDSRTLIRLDQAYRETVSGPSDTTAVLTVVDAATGQGRRVATLRARDEGTGDERVFRDGSQPWSMWQFEPAGVSAEGGTVYLWRSEQYVADPSLLPDYHAFSIRTTLLAVDLARGAVTTLCTATGMRGDVSWLPGYVLRPTKTARAK